MRSKSHPTLFGRPVRVLHLVGAGGMGMAPLGLFLAQLGVAVTAEDDHWNPATQGWLQRAGVQLVPPGTLPAEAEAVVFSSAVAAPHPTRRAAAVRGIPQVRRGEMLAELTRGKKLVAVVGSHGKTTTTAMLITALQSAGFPCGWLLGGLFNDDALPPARVGSTNWVIAEIDESDGTIDGFAPEITLAVNLDWDHPDFYLQIADLEATFAALFARTRSAVFISDACPVSARLVARGDLRAPVFTFGRTGDFKCNLLGDITAGQKLGLGGRFTLHEAIVRARGDFNAANAGAALAVAQYLGAGIAGNSLAAFAGVRRRQSQIQAAKGCTIYEDYAHHPTEIRALLGALRQGAAGRLLVVFQPHRYTRTAQFKTEFAAALAGADALFLMDVYAASETPVPGGTTADLYAEIRKTGAAMPVTHLPGNDAGLPAAIRTALRDGDTLVFVGAGDIDQTARQFAARLQAEEQREAAWTGFLTGARGAVSSATRLVEGEALGAKTTMRVGGPARIYAEPANPDDLQLLLKTADARGLPVFVLGRGSNIIVPDEGVDGLVLSLGHANWKQFELQPDGRVWVGAGLRLKQLCGLAAKAGLQGFEFLEGIPGSVGGALRMNAGAMGGWMFDVVEEVHLMTFQGERRVLKKADMHFHYRRCPDLGKAIALGALLMPAARADAAEIRSRIEFYQRKRQETQPREPSAGCVFKNPPGQSAGKLIDEAGLKGERIGDAMVSSVHANFIVNQGHATSADIIALMRRVRERVKQARGIELEPEVLLCGKEWGEVL
ncbi:MAG: UDP-N-acetylmuramate dehydrogenase [Opitutaceae bacterium]|nr:UDP-N-acetylmuramate dehydrogenase [Opitutaceae bacterium]